MSGRMVGEVMYLTKSAIVAQKRPETKSDAKVWPLKEVLMTRDSWQSSSRKTSLRMVRSRSSAADSSSSLCQMRIW